MKTKHPYESPYSRDGRAKTYINIRVPTEALMDVDEYALQYAQNTGKPFRSRQETITHLIRQALIGAGIKGGWACPDDGAKP